MEDRHILIIFQSEACYLLIPLKHGSAHRKSTKHDVKYLTERTNRAVRPQRKSGCSLPVVYRHCLAGAADRMDIFCIICYLGYTSTKQRRFPAASLVLILEVMQVLWRDTH